MTTAAPHVGAGESAQTLAETVLEMAEADASLPDEVELLIFAALDSDEMLDEALGGTSKSMDQVRATVRNSEPPPAGAYLSAIAVQGFRGVGPEIKVVFAPGPGLTVISGRNGSGKSSIAEALEFALTGTSARSTKHAGPIWTGSWRNLHEAAVTRARLTLAEEGSGSTEIGVDWDATAGIDGSTSWVQRKGKKREPGRSSLGWSTGLDLYRPLLSYDELGGLLEGKPSELFDKLHILLGLESVTTAEQRLKAVQKNQKLITDEAKKQLTGVRAAVAASTDERAATAAAVLKPRLVNLDLVQQLITGAGTQDDSELSQLRVLAALNVPDVEQVTGLAAELAAAATAMDEATTDRASAQSAALDVLIAAVDLHDEQGDMLCPICGLGELDEDWAVRAAAVVGSARRSDVHIKAVTERLMAAQRAAAGFRSAVRPLVIPEALELVTAPQAARAVATFLAAQTDSSALAHHLRATAAPLAAALESLKGEALQAISEREDRWAPIATQLAAWLGAESRARDEAGQTALVKKAIDWLRDCSDALRQQRLAPISEQARLIWSRLRQESNVELGAISLTGQMTSRKVVLEAQVDGQAAGALGVMSQGELHALSLALFIPRATMPASPFRFIVLDDPIQAMDPSKVDGFVTVLGELAKTRQVIVLSHDDRLASAVRRSSFDARLMEVSRGTGSVISVRSASDPAERHLADAFAIAKDNAVAVEVARSVIPALCRLGLESAALDVFRARRLKDGASHGELEAEWQKAKKLRERLALALHLDVDARIDGWLKLGSKRQTAFTICNSNVHTGLTLLNAADSVHAVRAAVEDLRKVAV